ncbi:MAG TPA: nuclear transport factor 2 family protein [Candidatus Hydrogenedentes bacterium]|nr:nuclear transport factor 2 family protein [Candidatus Hydrogenedentota bacterium]HPG65930.1 nuclear transport factor 2 family protein [Candidatus Hydrogenedentota bacterium]
MLPEPKAFAAEWIDAWNAHDLDRILAHYADDVEVTTPMIQVALGVTDGTLRGRVAVRRYWEAALRKVPDLRFELVDYAQGVESIAVYYRSVMNKMAIEVMHFSAEGKVSRVVAHYT